MDDNKSTDFKYRVTYFSLLGVWQGVLSKLRLGAGSFVLP